MLLQPSLGMQRCRTKDSVSVIFGQFSCPLDLVELKLVSLSLRLATLAPWQAGKVHTQPRVNSLNYLQELEPGKFAVKIFSRHVLSDLELQEAFGLDNVLWSHRQPWLSYPFVRPLKPHDFGSLHLDEGLYYTSPMGQSASIAPLLLPCLAPRIRSH